MMLWLMLGFANVHEYVLGLQQLSILPLPCLSIFSEADLVLSLSP